MTVSVASAKEKFYVYVHSRLSTGEPFYIGKGSAKRAYSTRGRNRYWSRIVSKDGGFYASLLISGVDEDLSMIVEMESIDLFRRRGCSLVNMTDGGDGASGHYPSEETRIKLSRSSANKGKPAWNRGKPSWNRGIPMSAETLSKLSAIRKGRRLSEEHKAKIASAMAGKRKTEETKAKLSIAHKGKIISAETRARLVEAWKRRRQ